MHASRDRAIALSGRQHAVEIGDAFEACGCGAVAATHATLRFPRSGRRSAFGAPSRCGSSWTRIRRNAKFRDDHRSHGTGWSSNGGSNSRAL